MIAASNSWLSSCPNLPHWGTVTWDLSLLYPELVLVRILGYLFALFHFITATEMKLENWRTWFNKTAENEKFFQDYRFKWSVWNGDITRHSLHTFYKIPQSFNYFHCRSSREMAQPIKDFPYIACLPAMLLASHASLIGDHPTNERPCLKGGGYYAA